MIKLPKIRKPIQRSFTQLENVRKVVLGVALVTTIALTGGGIVSDAEASVSVMPKQVMEQGALLLTPAIQVGDQGEYHYSHSSHASHSSHYSSRY